MFDFTMADGFIFDCDGTLLDTLNAWDEAERDLFAQAGELTQAQEDEIHAAPIEQAAAILHERYGVGKSAEDVLAHLDNHLLPHYRDISVPMAGALEFVRAVHERGIPCVVVSSSPRRYLAAGLERAGVLDCFKELVSTDEVGASKQDFKIYEVAVRELGCEASRASSSRFPQSINTPRDGGVPLGTGQMSRVFLVIDLWFANCNRDPVSVAVEIADQKDTRHLARPQWHAPVPRCVNRLRESR